MLSHRRDIPPPLPSVPPPQDLSPIPTPSSCEASSLSELPPTPAGPGKSEMADPPSGHFKRSKTRVRRRHVIEHFNLMVVGPRGVGKTSFLDTLCSSFSSAQTTSLEQHDSLRRSAYLMDSRPSSARSNVRASMLPPVSENSRTAYAKDGIVLKTLTVDDFEETILLNLIDTPGWNHDDSGEEASSVYRKIVAFLEEQMDKRVVEELKVRRDKYAPNLIVHACLYFMDPNQVGFRATDIHIIKELGTRVNLIPVVGKADLITLTRKLQLQSDFVVGMKRYADQVTLFDLPGDGEGPETDLNTRDSVCLEGPDGDSDGLGAGAPPSVMMPFFLFNHEPIDPHTLAPFEKLATSETSLLGFKSVLDTLTRTHAKNPLFLGRCYPWGRIDCMNPEHCDFSIVRSMLFESHRDMLRQHTLGVIYEDYRARQLQSSKRDELLQRCGSRKIHRVFRDIEQQMNNLS
ncbi:hypothetical protein IWQ62_000558 [Dispira parvispora]|uniref:Septin-type G domain-containing protein n=1 Tax=Dispira parvispora TaxID=1520584 RepID=A0A9W8AVN2_9FUNG|nr:hypothetical protein IWQ62_000558 [Dispira parvispora]